MPVCIQPLFVQLKADDFAEKLGLNGRRLANTICPLKTFLREKVHVAFGADVPAFPSYLPMDSIRCAMERITKEGHKLDTNESISFLEALKIHTLGSAFAAFDEKEPGSLETGKFADFVVWNTDLRKIKTGKEVMQLRPLATYVNGKSVYQAG